MIRRPPRSTRTATLFPYTTLFRSQLGSRLSEAGGAREERRRSRGALHDPADRARHRLPCHPIERRRRARCDDLPADRGSLPVPPRDQCGGRSRRQRLWLAPELVAGTAALALIRNTFQTLRSEERRVGKECVSTCRYRVSP